MLNIAIVFLARLCTCNKLSVAKLGTDWKRVLEFLDLFEILLVSTNLFTNPFVVVSKAILYFLLKFV